MSGEVLAYGLLLLTCLVALVVALLIHP